MDAIGVRIHATQANRRLTMAKITGRRDGPGGRNEHYDVGSRKNVTRPVVVKEVERGQHPGKHIYEINGQKFVRDNPDSSTKDNVNH
jgi:hypothetical protein